MSQRFLNACVLGLLLCAGGYRAHAQDGSHLKDCRTLAQSRLGLYVHSDIYPLSDKEKSDALDSLISECMKPYESAHAPAQPPPPAPPVKAAAPAAPFQTAQPITETASSTQIRQATAAPVTPVTISTPLAAPAAAPPSDIVHPAPAMSAPFSVAVPPSPALAQRINPAPLKPRAMPTPSATAGEDATSQLEKIINKE